MVALITSLLTGNILSETGTFLFSGTTFKHTLENITLLPRVASTLLPRVASTLLPRVASTLLPCVATTLLPHVAGKNFV